MDYISFRIDDRIGCRKAGDYMDTIARVMELADERNLSLFKLSQLCDVSYSTLKNAEMRGSQLGVPTIERICVALGVTLSDFFAEADSVYTK